MSMMEAMMILYAKEVATSDRVQAAIQRFSHHARASPDSAPVEPEQALLSWIREAVAALRQKIKQEKEQGGGVSRSCNDCVEVCVINDGNGPPKLILCLFVFSLEG